MDWKGPRATCAESSHRLPGRGREARTRGVTLLSPACLARPFASRLPNCNMIVHILHIILAASGCFRCCTAVHAHATCARQQGASAPRAQSCRSCSGSVCQKGTIHPPPATTAHPPPGLRILLPHGLRKDGARARMADDATHDDESALCCRPTRLLLLLCLSLGQLGSGGHHHQLSLSTAARHPQHPVPCCGQLRRAGRCVQVLEVVCGGSSPKWALLRWVNP